MAPSLELQLQNLIMEFCKNDPQALQLASTAAARGQSLMVHVFPQTKDAVATAIPTESNEIESKVDAQGNVVSGVFTDSDDVFLHDVGRMILRRRRKSNT